MESVTGNGNRKKEVNILTALTREDGGGTGGLDAVHITYRVTIRRVQNKTARGMCVCVCV